MYIVTGGAGFIGSNVVAALEARGANDIVIIDRLRDGVKWRNVAKRELSNIIHPDNMKEYLNSNGKAARALIHMGAISATTERNADLIIDTNFHLTWWLWEWCAKNDVQFIYASSAATYGDGSAGFNDDFSCSALARLQPLNAYGWSKHLFDRRVARAIADGGKTPPQWAGLKFFNVYGPNEYHKGQQQSVISHIYPKAKKGETFSLFRSHNPNYADGGQLRDFIWVGDCADVIIWLLENRHVSGLFNVGTGQARSFMDLASAVYNSLGKQPMIDFVDTPENIRDKYQYFTEANMDKLRNAGYDRQFTSLEDGVERYVRGYLDTSDAHR